MTTPKCLKCHHATRLSFDRQLYHSVPVKVGYDGRRARALLQECWCGCTSPQGRA